MIQSTVCIPSTDFAAPSSWNQIAACVHNSQLSHINPEQLMVEALQVSSARLTLCLHFRSFHRPRCGAKLDRTSMASRKALGTSWHADPDKPWFHVMPREGWLNDPNGGKRCCFSLPKAGTTFCCILWLEAAHGSPTLLLEPAELCLQLYVLQGLYIIKDVIMCKCWHTSCLNLLRSVHKRLRARFMCGAA